MNDDQPLTVAEVCELPAGTEGDPSWINGGFRGILYNIASKQSKAGKSYWVLSIGDSDNEAKVEMSVFTAPRCQQGDEIEVMGKGLRRTEYNGKAQVAMSKTAEIHTVNRQAPKAAAQRPSVAPESALPAHERPQGVQGPPMHGATAGMAVKEALAVHALAYSGYGPSLGDALQDLHFWVAVEKTATRIARIAQALEQGTIAVRAPQAPSEPVRPPAQAPKPQPVPDEDVPF